jgi:hypothetical protein
MKQHNAPGFFSLRDSTLSDQGMEERPYALGRPGPVVDTNYD